MIPEHFQARIKEAKEENLKELDLSSEWNTKDNEKFKKIPDEVFELKQLEVLNFKNNQLTTLPKAVEKLSSLTWLDLSNNQFKTLPEVIGELSNLSRLYLSNNQFKTLPEVIGELSNLSRLYLSNNQLTTLPEVVENLSNLTGLYLTSNQFKTLPEVIGKLSNLAWLNLNHNQLTMLPEIVGNLYNLVGLYLTSNQLTTLPEIIGKLSNLTQLYLNENQLTTLPEEIGNLSNLNHLNLSYNQLITLPEAIGNLSNLNHLNLSYNPLTKPPIEIAERGIEAIREYFQQIKEGIDYIYEAKLLIVGEAGAGKTTLANKIQNPEYQLREEDSTQGIEVNQWHFPQQDKPDFRVNIWDFGGQEIYHATHQFFLTKRSFYALVVDNRKEDTDFYYWLSIVELLSDNSPVLIIKNQKQNRERDINERGLRGEFINLKEVLDTNLKTNLGLDEILKETRHYISSLPHVGDALPKTWKQVREVLEQDKRNWIELQEYLSICSDNGFKQDKDSLQLSDYLHDLGVILYFQEDWILSKTVILKPQWGTTAVYRVLDNKTVRHNLGQFTKKDLELIWKDKEYANMQHQLLQLMKKFKLCYSIPETEGVWIAPQLLTENQPKYEWNNENNLIFRYTYEFMPKGIITRFIVAIHRYIEEQQYVWRSGVVLRKDETRAEVVEYYGKREIKIRIAGRYKKDLMSIVTYELDKIHDSYKRLKYQKLIPCNCPVCNGSQEPYFYQFKELQEMSFHGEKTIQCRKPPSYNTVDIIKLIDDTLEFRQLYANEEKQPDRTKIENYNNISFKGPTNLGNIIMSNSTDSSRKVQIGDISGNVAAGNLVNQGDNASFQGNVTQSIDSVPDKEKQEIQELLGQLQKVIASSPDLNEKSKNRAQKKVSSLVKATENPSDEDKQESAEDAITVLETIFSKLPATAALLTICEKLFPALTNWFGLG